MKQMSTCQHCKQTGEMQIRALVWFGLLLLEVSGFDWKGVEELASSLLGAKAVF